MKKEIINGRQTAYLEGEINGSTGLAYKEEIASLFSSSAIVVLSFKDVVYLNSSGLREIIDLLKQANKLKVELRLCEMSKDIREMFSFTGLEKVFKIFDTMDQAAV
ncbi:MAG: STAS domain-containing protein [Deferribacteraceae bacterium]|jgi:anti-sigma B factor antagonist|nr:STAS domain-containing protein [Deferribacteraceae bacterium]